MNMSELENSFVPVMPKRNNGSSLKLIDWLNFRTNILSTWSDKAYRARSLEFKLYNQPYFLCNSADTVRRVFLENHDNYDRKSPQMRHALEPLLGDGLFVNDGDLWKQRRKSCSPPFEKEFLPRFTQIMSNSAVEMSNQWANLPEDKPVDILNEMAKLTAQIIGRTIFGDNVPKDDIAAVVSGFTAYQENIDQLRISDTFGIPFFRHFINPFKKAKLNAAKTKVHKVIDRIIERHKKGDKPEDLTLLSVLLDGDTGKSGKSGKSGCPMSSSAARNEAIVMFMAGHETTANALAWTWYLLDGCQRSKKRMLKEIDDELQGRPPSIEDVSRLPYTRAVFEEALRLYPPVPLLSRQARRADIMRDQIIVPGTIILALPWLLHRHEKEWQKPNSFYPERFLPGQPKPNKFIYMPFSVGRRVCLGVRFGLTEGIICLATLAQNFDLQLAPGHSVEIECRLTLRPKDGLPMILKKRSRV
jgi:cytochrome P450